MPTISLNINLLAGATNNNIVAGEKFEFIPINPPQAAAVVLYMVTDLQPDVEIDFTLGTTVVGDNMVVMNEPAALTGPLRNEHLLSSGVGAPGDRIQIRARNTNGAAARILRALIDIRPV